MKRVASDEPDLIDRIANALPAEVRPDYYKELRHCQDLPQNDEMLRLLRAMQFLTLLMTEVPAKVGIHREKLEQLLNSATQIIQENLRSGHALHKALNDRLVRLPNQIAKGISPETIAATINESLRQQFIRSTIPETARALDMVVATMKETVADFSFTTEALTDAYNGSAELARQSIEKMERSISAAAKSARTAAEALSGAFWRSYRWSVYTFSCAGLILGFALGMVFEQWRNRPLDRTGNKPKIEAPSTIAAPQLKQKR